MIDIVADASDSLAGHLNEFGTDVDAFDDIAEAGKVFAQPTGTASHIQNPGPGRQRQRHRDVRKVTKMPECLGIHSFARVFWRLVGQIVKRFREEIMAALGIEHAHILDRCLFVVHAFQFSQSSALMNAHLGGRGLNDSCSHAHPAL